MDENVIAAEIQAVIKDINRGAINKLDDLFQRFQDTNFVKKSSREYMQVVITCGNGMEGTGLNLN